MFIFYNQNEHGEPDLSFLTFKIFTRCLNYAYFAIEALVREAPWSQRVRCWMGSAGGFPVLPADRIEELDRLDSIARKEAREQGHTQPLVPEVAANT